MLAQVREKTALCSQLEEAVETGRKEAEAVRARNERLEQEVLRVKEDKVDLQSLSMRKDAVIEELSQQV